MKIKAGKRNLVRNTDHKREKSACITQMITEISSMFSNPEMAISYMKGIHVEKPRYARDQLILLKQTIENADRQTIDQALQYCLEMKVYSANDFKSVAAGLLHKKIMEKVHCTQPREKSVEWAKSECGILSTNAKCHCRL